MRIIPIFVVAATVSVVQAAPRLGSDLAQRMQLVYSSDGVETPWTVDSISHDTTFGGRRGCFRMRLRTSPTQTIGDVRAQCADSATMYTWVEAAGEVRPVRLLTPNSSRDFSLSAGRVARYETGARATDVIGGRSIAVIPTTVTTRDSTGRVISRLRERFSIALATATTGIFEAPDSTQAGGWRVTRKFDLVAVRAP